MWRAKIISNSSQNTFFKPKIREWMSTTPFQQLPKLVLKIYALLKLSKTYAKFSKPLGTSESLWVHHPVSESSVDLENRWRKIFLATY
jgi:hypothetical protein